MYDLINSDDRRVNFILTVGAWLLLAGCLAYNIYLVWATPNSGLSFDARWQILAVAACPAGTESCRDATALQNGDRLLRIGGITFEDYVDNPDLPPFQGYLPGEVVRLVIHRDGQTFEVDWRLRAVEVTTIVRFGVISLLVYGSFWVAGTYVLRYLRPADLTWLLLISLFYMIMIWLAVGLYAQSNVAHSALILRVVGWLLAPVMVHLHLVVPYSRLDPRLRPAVAAMYGAAIVMLLLQLLGLLPWLAYLAGILLAALASFGLLAYRIAKPGAPAEKLAARLMLTGIVLALVPGLVLSAIPLLLDIGATSAIGPAFSVLALPMLPLFYTYAIYKHRLGVRERRVNRLLVQYALVLMYFVFLSLVFVIMSNWMWTANALLSFVALLGLSIIVALLPVRRPLQTVFDRLTYGTRYSHREILAEFAERIPAAVDSQELVHLLKYELAPEMDIRQSALAVRRDELVTQLYSQGVGHEEMPSSWAETRTILDNTENFMTTGTQPGRVSAGPFDWVQLAFPLRVKERWTGVWFFGRRDRDNIYSQEDIDLLDRLSGLVAVTLESGQLLDALSHELEVRKQAEERLAEQSERLSRLHEIDLAVLAAESPAGIARAAFAGLRRLVPCARVSVFIFDVDHDLLTILAAQGSGTDIVAENDSFPLSAVPVVDTLLKGQVYVTDDMKRSSSGSRLTQSLTSSGVRAVVSAPLIASGSVFGALTVANSEPASYQPRHVAIVEEVATSVALAIHNARLREELNRNSQELRLLSAHLINAQETERKRLSHELHDEMGQLLTAISLNLAAIERNLPETGNESLRQQLAGANDFVLGLTDQVRSLSLELRPSMLHDLGLISTLRWYVTNYARRNNAEIRFDADNNLPDHLPENVEITAYRVVQEALTNASRHSGATSVDLTVLGQNGCIQVVIEDNGRGFDVDVAPDDQIAAAGIGLALMRERVAAVNGQLKVRSELGKGTRISAEIPIEALI